MLQKVYRNLLLFDLYMKSTLISGDSA